MAELNEWQVWYKEQIEKCQTIDVPKRMLVMYQLYGQEKDHKCKECEFLQARAFANTYYKCLKSKVTSGPATDWRVNWMACGRFKKGGT